MKRVLTAAMILLLSACSSPELKTDEMQRIAASIPSEEGKVLYATVAIWLPGSSDYRFKATEPKVPGVAVVTEKAFLFQQWGGVRGMTNLKRIPVSEIENAHLLPLGRSLRIALYQRGGSVDSFASSDGGGELSMQPGTREIHRVLTGLGAPSFPVSPP
ncbi:hypothetical protein [Massilia sp. GCM10023247]|uniref:hypothetical protein n=1 Tax=Massilia sp. GCM10023247 TaxID=3252643 RepID=UPI00360A798D